MNQPIIHSRFDIGMLVSIPFIGLGKILEVLPKFNQTHEPRSHRRYKILVLAKDKQVTVRRSEFKKL